MPDTRRYQGGCHCRHVRFEVETDLSPLVSCNCSICSARGLMLTFVGPDKFTLVAGGDDLVDYRFNKMVIHHLFCPKCGVESFARGRNKDGGEMIAINVRCLDDVDLDGLVPMKFDGQSL